MTLKPLEENDPQAPIRFDLAADKLLERPASAAYIQECSLIVSRETAFLPVRIEHTVIVFRLGKEWLALATDVFCEVTEKRIVRRIPHRSKDILKGLVNLGGQLTLCVDLAKFLEVESSSEQATSDKPKFIAIGQNQHKWVFPVDEIIGLFPCAMESLVKVM